MRTYELRNQQGELHAFEISSLIGRRSACRIAASMPGASILRRALREDEFCEFEIGGDRCLIEEPFGDNSRYWIGPAPGRSGKTIADVRNHFAAHRLGKVMMRLSVLLLVLMLGLVLLNPVIRFIRQDRCLDHGGRWNAGHDSCEMPAMNTR